VALSAVLAAALLRAVGPEEAIRTDVRTAGSGIALGALAVAIARPAGIAHAGPALRLALSVVLAGTVLLALGAMFPVWTAHVASSWSGGLVGGFGRIS